MGVRPVSNEQSHLPSNGVLMKEMLAAFKELDDGNSEQNTRAHNSRNQTKEIAFKQMKKSIDQIWHCIHRASRRQLATPFSKLYSFLHCIYRSGPGGNVATVLLNFSNFFH